MTFTKILVGYDGSPGAKKALGAACELAHSTGAEIWALAVLEHLPKYAASVGEVEEATRQGRAYLQEVLDGGRETARALGIELRVDQAAGQPALAIVRYADEGGFDLIVMGHSGHSGLWGTFLGTTADKAMRHAHCTVMVVR